MAAWPFNRNPNAEKRLPMLHILTHIDGVLLCSCGIKEQMTDDAEVSEFIRQHCLSKSEPAILLRNPTTETEE